MENLRISRLMRIFTGVFLIAAVIAVIVAANGNVNANNSNANNSNANNVGIIEINISPVKNVYYVGDEITIDFSVTPNKNGCFATLTFTKINGSMDTLFQHEPGCKPCGTAKSPLRSKTSRTIKKTFDAEGIYVIGGEITDADTVKREYKTIKIVVKEKNDKGNDKGNDKRNDDGTVENVNANSNNDRIPIVIEVFTHNGCPICYHVDEAVEKLAKEYNKKVKNSVIILEYHLQDAQANSIGVKRRIFYHGNKWQNICNYYALTLINGEDESCGGTHNTESDYLNLKNKIENKNKNLVPTVSMRANASYNIQMLYVDVKVKNASSMAKNLDITVFILDGTNVKVYLQKSVNTNKKQTASAKFSFPYSEIFAYKNLKIVAVVQGEDKKILNARLIERKDVKEIKEIKILTKKKNINLANNMNTTNISSSKTYFETASYINFIYNVASGNTLYCAINFALYNGVHDTQNEI